MKFDKIKAMFTQRITHVKTKVMASGMLITMTSALVSATNDTAATITDMINTYLPYIFVLIILILAIWGITKVFRK